MRHLYKIFLSKPIQLLLLALVLLSAGCSTERTTGFNRFMQNTTAHYNILFNANDLLRQKQEIYQTGFIDAYNQFLNVYQDTTAHSSAADKELDAAITKANTIISTKEQSKYIGDAYLVLGKANFLYGHYFNAVEFFKYVTTAYPKNKALLQEARIWQARALLYLNQMPQAKTVVDSTLRNVNPKKNITADVYATALQFDINAYEYVDAEKMAKLAVKYANTKTQRLRWTFILAQLQEMNKEPQDAYGNYRKVEKSNASFEMAFNANLNRIRLENAQNGRGLTRMQSLRQLLKDDKNVDFTDQIYYQIALLYLADNDIPNAIKNLNLSIHYSNKNQNQKGVSYLRLADINFKNLANYVKAKKYYDSTLMNLSPSYPDYSLIQKKGQNLQVLADKLQIIGREDTLQSLAKLQDPELTKRIDELVAAHTLQLQQAAAATGPDPLNNSYSNSIAQGGSGSGGASSFYFYNSAAVSQGFSDFKRVWGARKLEDNWRRAKKTSGDATANQAAAPGSTDPDALPGSATKSTDAISSGNYRQSLVQNIPNTQPKMDASNQKVYNAYSDIAGFYRDILSDKKEAIASYELMLKRYPNDPNKAAIYYNLYRLYSDIDAAKSEDYKNRVLKEYPNSIYAKVIADPDYSRKMDDKDAVVNAQYDDLYRLYTMRQYTPVVDKADSLLTTYPNNKLAAQMAYLRTIANGHKEPLDPFKAELGGIATKYPNDKLITPLVTQHLAYIDANKEKMAARKYALIDDDPNEEKFIPPAVPQNNIKPPVASQPVVNQPVQKPAVQKPPVQPPVKTNQPVTTPQQIAANKPVVQTPANPPANNPAKTQPAPTQTAPVAAPKSIFSMRDSTNYYFVVNVSTSTLNLSSSRFGIGQFNRANYQGSSISHQLKDAGPDNQLIYVGHFTSLNAVKTYARNIIPLMPQIMKVPADKYSFFIITQENLDKLADRKTLDSYMDFYQKNY